MAKTFNLAAFMPGADVSKLDTPTREVKQLPTRSVFPNDKNFYDTSNVSDLIDSILLHGLLDPLTVRPAGDGEGYIIISGHRRHKAVMTILDDALAEDLTPFETVPCFVTEPRDELMEELMLIQANSATRVLTSAEVAKQAEKIETLLYQLKEQGYEFPGRMRDYVAKVCNVAASRLGRLKIIREKLIPELYERFEAGEMPENAAYEAARLPERTQQILAQRHKEWITLWEVNNVKSWLENVDSLKECSYGDGICDQYETRVGMYLERGYCTCAGRCCMDCSSLATCDKACTKCADRQSVLIAEREQREEKERAERNARQAEAKTREDARKQQASYLWQRLGMAREAAGITGKAFYNDVLQWNLNDDELEGICVQEEVKIPDGWFDDEPFCDDVEEVRLAASALNCTTDYLLGVSDEPQPSGAGRWYSVDTDDLPEEGQAVIVLTRFVASAAWLCNTSVFRSGEFRFTQDLDMELCGVQYWMPSPELPTT